MNINAYRNGDLTISPTAKYLVNGKPLTAKEFKQYIGLEEDQNAEPESDTPVKKTSSKGRRSSTRKVPKDTEAGE